VATDNGPPPDPATVTAYVDAASPGLGPADLIFVFGTHISDPAPVAADIYHAGLSPVIVLTGGPNRYNLAHVEADAHAELLRAAGVPPAAMIIERRSTNTLENVTLAGPLIRQAVGQPRTAIAVVKWHHRRAVLLLARHVPSLTRIFTVTYEPHDPNTGRPVTRRNWPELSPGRVRGEFDAIRLLIANRDVDELSASGHGWTRLP
jgi:DUF218 domain